MWTNENKNPLIISRTILDALDPYHRAAASILVKRGEAVITDAAPAPGGLP